MIQAENMAAEAMEYTPLKGEGEMKFTLQKRVRRECDNCGEPATKRFSFCYINGRRNPASSMYGRDDCTWCSDAEAYSCNECEKEVKRVCCPDGMDWGGTVTAGSNLDHMFLHWVDRPATSSDLLALKEIRP